MPANGHHGLGVGGLGTGAEDDWNAIRRTIRNRFVPSEQDDDPICGRVVDRDAGKSSFELAGNRAGLRDGGLLRLQSPQRLVPRPPKTGDILCCILSQRLTIGLHHWLSGSGRCEQRWHEKKPSHPLASVISGPLTQADRGNGTPRYLSGSKNMPNHTRNSPSTPVIAVLLLVAAVLGGFIARFIPAVGGGSPTPAMATPLGGERTLAPLVKASSPAVVNIRVEQPSPAEQNPLLQDPFFRRYMGVPDSAMQPAIAAGSGAIVDGARGLVITNFHVVQNARSVEVGLKDGRHFAADPVALAPELDLAVLRIGAKDLPSLELANSDKLEVGDYVVAIGNPFGIGQTVTSGIVSATNRTLGQNDARRFIQTDAPINPGNSGGPLIDLHGKVVGINSALFSPDRGQGNVGIGFAIPANVVRKVLAEAERAK